MQDILAERLNTEFLLHRVGWIKGLDEVITHVITDEEPTPQPPTGHGLRTISLTSHSNSGYNAPHGLRAIQTIDFSEGGEEYLQDLAHMMELGFGEPICRRGLREMRGQGVEAAINWVVANYETFESYSPVRSAEAAVSPGNRGSKEVMVFPTAETAQVPEVASRTGQRLLKSIGALHRGIKSHPSVTHLSRQVVTIFLSRRLPSEVCWLIFSYTMSSEEIKNIILGAIPTDTYNERDLSLRVNANSTANMLRSAGYFLSARQKRILDAKISTPDTLQG